MATDNIENKLEKDEIEKPKTETIDAQLSHIDVEDEKPHPTFVANPEKIKQSFGQRLKALLKSKKFWAIILAIVLVALIAAWLVNPSRWWLLTTIGQRTTLTIQAIAPAEDRQQAAKLKNVDVTVNGQAYKTNQKGEVAITDQPYGKVTIKAKKQGYADAAYEGTINFDPFFYAFGSRNADEAAKKVDLELKAVGVPVSFKAVDYLSGQPVVAGEYSVGDLIIKPDDKGVVAFKAPAQDEDSGIVTVNTNFVGKYLDKKFDLKLNQPNVATVSFVPGGKHYFMSKRDGALGIYSSNLDGSGVQQLIPGTGKESQYTPFAVSPNGKHGVMASTRDGAKDSKGSPLQRLYVVDLEKKKLTKVDEGQRFELVDWSGEKLVYAKDQPVTDEAVPNSQLKTLEVTTHKMQDIATGRGFGRKVVSFDQIVFFQTDLIDATNLTYKTTIKRTDLKTNATKELANGVNGDIIQPDFDRVAFQTQADQKWHEYNFNTGQLKDAAQPSAQNTKIFLGSPSPDGSTRLMIDRIDGKFTLIAKKTADGAEKELYAEGGLGGPVRWIQDNVIVFRVVNDRETADYAISTQGGAPKKITDVTAVVGTQGSATDFRYY